MKKWIRSYFSFSRWEWIGIVSMIILLFLLAGLRFTMTYWVHPGFDSVQERQLRTAWEKYKEAMPARHDTTTSGAEKYSDASDENDSALPNVIDINTADSGTLIRLKGIGPVTAHHILERRRNRGPFTNPSQLREIGSFTDDNFALLKKHLSFDTVSIRLH